MFSFIVFFTYICIPMACIFVHINIYRVYIVTYQSCHFCTCHTCLYFIQPPTPMPSVLVQVHTHYWQHIRSFSFLVLICTLWTTDLYMCKWNNIYAHKYTVCILCCQKLFFLKVFWWKGTFLTTKLSLASKKYTYTGFENVIGRPLPLPTCTFIKADVNDF